MTPRTVQVWLNGQPRQVPEESTLADLLGEPVPGVAAAVNGEVMPRQKWRVYRLRDGDRVEFVQAVQGG